MTQSPGFNPAFRLFTPASGTGPLNPRPETAVTSTSPTTSLPGDQSAATGRPGHTSAPASVQFGTPAAPPAPGGLLGMLHRISPELAQTIEAEVTRMGLPSLDALPGVQALTTITGVMTEAVQDIDAVREATGVLNTLVADLTRTRTEVEQDRQTVVALQADIARAEIEGTEIEADAQILAEADQAPPNQEPRFTEPAKGRRWDALLRREGFTRTESGGWFSALHQRTFDQPGPLRRFLRERIEHRRGVFRQRMGALRARLGQASQRLSEGLVRLRGLSDAVTRQQGVLGNLIDRARQSTDRMQATLRDPAIRSQLPPAMLAALDAQGGRIAADCQQVSETAKHSMQSADKAKADAGLTLAEGIALLDQVDPTGKLTQELKPKSNPAVALPSRVREARQAIDQLRAQPTGKASAENLLNSFERELAELEEAYSEASQQRQEGQNLDQQLEQDFGTRLRTSIEHHQQQLEALDLRRSEQLDSLLARP